MPSRLTMICHIMKVIEYDYVHFGTQVTKESTLLEYCFFVKKIHALICLTKPRSYKLALRYLCTTSFTNQFKRTRISLY